MKIIVQSTDKKKTFKSNYFSNASLLGIEGMVTFVFIFGIVGLTILSNSSINNSSASFMSDSSLLAIPLFLIIIFFAYLYYFLEKRYKNFKNYKIDLNKLTINEEEILSKKWTAVKRSYSVRRSMIASSFEYFDLEIATNYGVESIPITTTEFIDFRDFVKENSDITITIRTPGIFE